MQVKNPQQRAKKWKILILVNAKLFLEAKNHSIFLKEIWNFALQFIAFFDSEILTVVAFFSGKNEDLFYVCNNRREYTEFPIFFVRAYRV